jgi:hypothetical protein
MNKLTTPSHLQNLLLLKVTQNLKFWKAVKIIVRCGKS